MRGSPRGPLRPQLRVACALLAIGCALACVREEKRVSEQAALPPGAWLAGDGAALTRFLGRLDGLRGSELARSAALLQERTAGCEQVLAHAEDGSLQTLVSNAGCVGAREVPAALDALRAGDSLVLSLPFDASRLDVRASVDAAGDVDARFSLVATADRAALEQQLAPAARLFVPAARDAGPARLNPEATLVHARLRPQDGIDLASLVPEVDAGGPLRRLAGSLVGAAVLDGTWEVAAYLPREGSAMPPIALALGLSSPTAARSLLDAIVAGLEATWPIRHRAAHFAVDTDAAAAPAEGSSPAGGCFFDIRILPEFAPCWVVAGDLFVLGWNPESVQRGLAPRAIRAGNPDAPGASDVSAHTAGIDGRGGSDSPGGAFAVVGPTQGALLSLDRWELADAAIGRVRAAGDLRRALHYGWRRAAIEALHDPSDALLSIRLQLVGADRS